MNLELAIILAAGLALAAAGAALVQGMRLYRARAEVRMLDGALGALRREVDVLQQDLGALCSGAHGVGGHLDRIDRRLTKLGQRQDQLELRDSAHREYDQAVRMIRHGAAREEIIEQCGLTRAEADLLIRLHAPQQRGKDGRAGMRSVA